MNESTGDFGNLVPDVMLDAVEQGLGQRMTAIASPLPSYINRVYEVETTLGERLIAKFYRPGRWSREALEDEHSFVLDCAEDEIPVVPPMKLANGDTLFDADGIQLAIFPKRAGRQLEISSVKDWVRVGRLLGRVHVVGSRSDASARMNLHPERSTVKHVDMLLDGGFVTPERVRAFDDVTSEILDLIYEQFDDVEFIRIHGDCHCCNLLKRPDVGIMMIDFDDMMVGPPVQDMWLLLPDRTELCREELNLLLRGYEQFREFDDHTIRLIEPLRAMRIIYFLAWCSQQFDDYKFQTMYPDWGSDAFWQKEIADLSAQCDVIREQVG